MRAITVGLGCNNACVFCAQGDLRVEKGGAPRDVGAEIAAIAAGEVVAFLGGEPTLYDDLPAWIRAADARGASRILVQTNGRRLAYKAYARALKEASPKLALDVSLQGANAAMHEYHTGVEGSFAQTVQGMRNARAERIPFGVTVVITRSSFRHLPEIARVAHASGAAAIHFAAALPFGRAARDRSRVIPATEMVAPYLSRAVTEARRLRMAVAVGDRAITPDAADAFPGLGEVEEPRAAEPVVKKRVSLRVASDHDGAVSPEVAEEASGDTRQGEHPKEQA
jgi:MoaA/NifB/PqqE/SkfB family radical SAM enzyme